MLEEIAGMAAPRIVHRPDVPLLPPAGQERVPEQPLPAVDAQHAQAVDAVFAQDDESSKVAGLLGLWLGVPPVLDMMSEQFHEEDDEDEDENKPQKVPGDKP